MTAPPGAAGRESRAGCVCGSRAAGTSDGGELSGNPGWTRAEPSCILCRGASRFQVARPGAVAGRGAPPPASHTPRHTQTAAAEAVGRDLWAGCWRSGGDVAEWQRRSGDPLWVWAARRWRRRVNAGGEPAEESRNSMQRSARSDLRHLDACQTETGAGHSNHLLRTRTQ